ncbi:MAG: hypothetical protein KF910_12375 [Brevundimonas sp.]|uniref:hypothetical protein n=1 Tax=Brevundimonas sp. TaxID=1871086 RepID=UPI0025C56EE6|nr:hypothetical protein [Brevundimonas sp.]MBX3478401.1 hypothetical protein [Brevundimonas sp.]
MLLDHGSALSDQSIMTGPSHNDEEAGPEDIVRAIREIVGEDDRLLTHEEVRELEMLRSRLKRPSRTSLRELGRSLAKPEKP